MMSFLRLSLILTLSSILNSCGFYVTPSRLEEGVQKVDALIIVHPTDAFDSEGEAKLAIRFIAKEFLRQRKTVITLIDAKSDLELKAYHDYFPEISETEVLESQNGEIKKILKGNKFVLTGGYLMACLRTSLMHLTKNNLSNENPLIEIYVPLPAVYGKDLKLSEEDQRKVGIHGWVPKDAGLVIYNRGEKFFSLRETSLKLVKVYLRGPKESPMLHGFY